MQNRTAVYIEPEEVKSKLDELGIPLGTLLDAVDAWASAAADATSYQPVGAANMMGWIKGVGTLREQLSLTENRTSDNIRNWPVVVDRQLQLYISVCSGDYATGLDVPGQQPSTKNPRGTVVERSLKGENPSQLRLSYPATFFKAIGKRDPEYAVWFLLVYWYRPKDRFGHPPEVRAELSRATGIDSGSRKIVEWGDRIILPVQPPSSTITRKRYDDEESGSQDLDELVTRK